MVLDETYRRKAERTETRLEQKEGIVAVEDGGDDDDDEEEEEEEETPRQILEKLGKKIRKQIPYLYCQYKTHARIPIIKLFARRQIYGNGFGSKWNSFNSDISVGNLLAIWNTRLLKHYCIIDERFKHLVLFRELCYSAFFSSFIPSLLFLPRKPLSFFRLKEREKKKKGRGGGFNDGLFLLLGRLI